MGDRNRPPKTVREGVKLAQAVLRGDDKAARELAIAIASSNKARNQ